MKSLESQYKGLNQNEINIEWNSAAKAGNYPKLKFMVEDKYVNVTPKMMNTSILRACSQNNLKIFKYMLKIEKDLKSLQWEDSIKAACGSEGKEVVEYILRKHKFTPQELSNAFMETRNNIPAFETLSRYVNVGNELKMGGGFYLQEVVRESYFKMVEFLINKYNADFTPFKDLALECRAFHNGDKVLKLIETQELFNALNHQLENKVESTQKKKKI